jgi:hypothetical protein
MVIDFQLHLLRNIFMERLELISYGSLSSTIFFYLTNCKEEKNKQTNKEG